MTCQHKPQFDLTIPSSLWEAVAMTCGPFLADVWLFGAYLAGDNLSFRTQTAHNSAVSDGRFMAVLDKLKMKPFCPTPFPGDGDRLTYEEGIRQIARRALQDR